MVMKNDLVMPVSAVETAQEVPEVIPDLEPIEVQTVETEAAPDAPNVRIPVNRAKIDGIASRIQSVDAFSKKYLTIMVYGLSGTGKTRFAATAKDVLIVDFEDGLLSVRNSKAKFFKVDSWDDVEALYWYLASQKERQFNTIAFDTLTRMQQIGLRRVVLDSAEKDPTKDVVLPNQRDWGVMTQKMTYWLQMFRQLPYHQIWLCQERTTSDDSEMQGFMGFPDLSRAVRNYTWQFADVIGRMSKRMKEDGTVEYILQTGASDVYVTKDRLNVLGAGMVNPNFEAIVNLMRGGKK